LGLSHSRSDWLAKIPLCLDSDQAGHDTAPRIAKQLLDEWEVEVPAHFPD